MLSQPLILGLGVPKAATTWIHRQLEAHPEISVTATKELGYWLRHYDKGADWYQKQFETKAESRVFAEFTPHYLNKKSLERIARDVKDGRFIISLRNPYERAYSDYLHLCRNGDINMSFEEACRAHPNIIWDSLYGDKLTMYLQHFSLDQLHIILFEDIERDAAGSVQKLYRFIGVRDFMPECLTQKVNVGRNRSRSDIYLKKLERTAKRIGITRKHLRVLHVDKWIENFQNALAKTNPKPQAISMQFLEHMLEPDIEVFSRLTGQDFSFWRPIRTDSGTEKPRNSTGSAS